MKALHRCLCPREAERGAGGGGGGGGAGAASTAVALPVALVGELALMVLATDGVLPVPVPAAGSLSIGAARALLPELHVLALQMLHSLLIAARIYPRLKSTAPNTAPNTPFPVWRSRCCTSCSLPPVQTHG